MSSSTTGEPPREPLRELAANWKRPSTGEPVTQLSVEFSLTHAELVIVLERYAALFGTDRVLLPAHVIDKVRVMLHMEGVRATHPLDERYPGLHVWAALHAKMVWKGSQS